MAVSDIDAHRKDAEIKARLEAAIVQRAILDAEDNCNLKVS